MDSEIVQENEIQVSDNPVIENKATDIRAARKVFSNIYIYPEIGKYSE